MGIDYAAAHKSPKMIASDKFHHRDDLVRQRKLALNLHIRRSWRLNCFMGLNEKSPERLDVRRAFLTVSMG